MKAVEHKRIVREMAQQHKTALASLKTQSFYQAEATRWQEVAETYSATIDHQDETIAALMTLLRSMGLSEADIDRELSVIRQTA